MIIKISFLLVLFLSAISAKSAVIQGQSDPFPLDTSLPVPLTWFALAVLAGLIGAYTLFRSLWARKKAAA